jgi:hypothetical protein
MAKARVFFDKYSPDAILVENLDSKSIGKFNFFAQDFVKHLPLAEISMIATDLKDTSMPQVENGYKIKLFGRLAHYVPSPADPEENRAPELLGLAPCNRVDLD